MTRWLSDCRCDDDNPGRCAIGCHCVDEFYACRCVCDCDCHYEQSDEGGEA